MKKLTVTMTDEAAKELQETAKAAGISLSEAVKISLRLGRDHLKKKQSPVGGDFIDRVMGMFGNR